MFHLNNASVGGCGQALHTAEAGTNKQLCRAGSSIRDGRERPHPAPLLPHTVFPLSDTPPRPPATARPRCHRPVRKSERAEKATTTHPEVFPEHGEADDFVRRVRQGHAEPPDQLRDVSGVEARQRQLVLVRPVPLLVGRVGKGIDPVRRNTPTCVFFFIRSCFRLLFRHQGLSCIYVYTNNAERARGATISPREGIGREERAGESCREKEHSEPCTTAAVCSLLRGGAVHVAHFQQASEAMRFYLERSEGGVSG